MKIIMTTLFGIEALTAEELTDMGYARENITIIDGQVQLRADDLPLAVARCNVFLRTAERVLVELAEYPASDFNTLFDRARKLALGRLDRAGGLLLSLTVIRVNRRCSAYRPARV